MNFQDEPVRSGKRELLASEPPLPQVITTAITHSSIEPKPAELENRMTQGFVIVTNLSTDTNTHERSEKLLPGDIEMTALGEGSAERCADEESWVEGRNYVDVYGETRDEAAAMDTNMQSEDTIEELEVEMICLCDFSGPVLPTNSEQDTATTSIDGILDQPHRLSATLPIPQGRVVESEMDSGLDYAERNEANNAVTKSTVETDTEEKKEVIELEPASLLNKYSLKRWNSLPEIAASASPLSTSADQNPRPEDELDSLRQLLAAEKQKTTKLALDLELEKASSAQIIDFRAERITSLEKEIVTSKQRNRLLQTSLDQVQKGNSDLRSLLEARTDRVKALNLVIRDRGARIERMKEEIEALENARESWCYARSSRISQLIREIATLLNRKNGLENEVAELQGKLERVSTERLEDDQRYREEMKGSVAEVARRKEEVKRLRGREAKSTSTIWQLTGEVDGLLNRKKSLQKEVEELKAKVEQESQCAAALDVELGRRKEEVTRLRKREADTQRETQATMTKNRQTLEATESKLAYTKAKLTDYRARSKALDAQLRQATEALELEKARSKRTLEEWGKVHLPAPVVNVQYAFSPLPSPTVPQFGGFTTSAHLPQGLRDPFGALPAPLTTGYCPPPFGQPREALRILPN
ncbi:hypothetical protein V5O48_011044 [Marasmius crinis-equi]|uniref:Uncharacterized protein n=1 Tax=Marasmius crinis-equi TaxID=585013 RepID=A0ABR3F751_9AGAR